MSEPRFDSLYSAWATIAGGTGYDSTYSAMKAALEKVTGQENYDSVYSIAVDFANDVESGSASVAKNTQLNEEITENGTYTFTPDEGYVYDSVTVSVDAGSKAEGTIKIVNNGTYDVTSYARANVAVGGESKPQIPNGFRFTGGDLALVDFGAYDWSMVYDMAMFFYGCSHSTGDWTNFEDNFDGNIFNGYGMFNNYIGTHLPTTLDLRNNWSCNRMFDQVKNVTNWDVIEGWDFSNVVNFEYIFGYSNIVAVPNINTSSVTNVREAFYSCRSLKDITNLKYWDFSNVTSVERMFQGCDISTVPDEVIEMPNVTKAAFMFAPTGSGSKMTKTPNLRIGKPCDCQDMFSRSTGLVEVNISGLIPTSVANMFEGCSSLPNADFISTWDFSRITSMTKMFKGCSKLISVPSMNTPNVTNFGGSTTGIFFGCNKLETVGEIDLSSAKVVDYMFADCYMLREVKFKGDPSKITNYASMFTNAGRDVEGGSTLYYDSRYDYSMIINLLPSTWTAVPYDVTE